MKRRRKGRVPRVFRRRGTHTTNRVRLAWRAWQRSMWRDSMAAFRWNLHRAMFGEPPIEVDSGW